MTAWADYCQGKATPAGEPASAAAAPNEAATTKEAEVVDFGRRRAARQGASAAAS
jgi:hypothetical protein